MDATFERELEQSGVTLWHEAGYKGEGINIFLDDVGGSHADRVYNVVHTITPDAVIYKGSIGLSISGNTVTRSVITCNGETYDFDEFITSHNIRIINNSKDGGNHDPNSPKAVWLRNKKLQHNLILVGSAGNGNGNPIDNSFLGAGIIVTGCNENKKSVYANDEMIDFTCYTAGQAGTSFAAPFFSGMVALILQRHPQWNENEIYGYFRTHSDDLGLPGKDIVFGHGLAFLGSVGTTVVLTIGSNYMNVDGQQVSLEQPAIIDPNTGRTLIPVRALAEALGCTVTWNGQDRTITIVQR